MQPLERGTETHDARCRRAGQGFRVFIRNSFGLHRLGTSMSRSKRARAKKRQLAAARSVPQSSKAAAVADSSRVAPARRRASVAKVGIGVAALVSVGVSAALARVTYAGHVKHPVQSLSIPRPLYRVVRQNLLQAGILAPATAPPDATTSTS